MRFTVHDSPDYYSLKVSVFNDDKKTDLIGETWIKLEQVIVQGGGQSDTWHTLHCKGKYAGEIRIELTYYDIRPKTEKSHLKPSENQEIRQLKYYGKSDKTHEATTKRRPLPAGPTAMVNKANSQPTVHNISKTHKPAHDTNDRMNDNYQVSESVMKNSLTKAAYHSLSYDEAQRPVYMENQQSEKSMSQQASEPLPFVAPYDKCYAEYVQPFVEETGIKHSQDTLATSSLEIPHGVSYNPYRSHEQLANRRAIRTQTEPILSYDANDRLYRAPLARPEHQLTSPELSSAYDEGCVLNDQKDDYLISSQRSDIPHAYSSQIGSIVHPLTLHRENDISQNIIDANHVHGADVLDRPVMSNNGGCSGEGSISTLGYTCNNLYEQRDNVPLQPNETMSHLNTEIQNQGDVPPPPPAHRSSIQIGERKDSQVSELMAADVLPPKYNINQHDLHRHSFPNQRWSTQPQHTSQTVRENILQKSFIEGADEPRYTFLANEQIMNQMDRQSQYDNLYQVNLQQRQPYENITHRSNTRLDFSSNHDVRSGFSGKRPLSLSVGGQHYKEDMHHSRGLQPAAQQSSLNSGLNHHSVDYADSPTRSLADCTNEGRNGSQIEYDRGPVQTVKPQAISPSVRQNQASNSSTPTRKSVSPRPARNNESPAATTTSSTPFSPEALETKSTAFVENLNISQAQRNRGGGCLSQGLSEVTPVPASSTATGNSSPHQLQADLTLDEAADSPIIGPDGRIIDPSDHLPVNSWAPEPERKVPQKAAPIRIRVSPRGAQPMPNARRENATRITAYTPSSASSFTPTSSTAPLQPSAHDESEILPFPVKTNRSERGRARLQKRPPGGNSSYSNLPTSLQERNSFGTHASTNMTSSYVATAAAPPQLPSKLHYNGNTGSGYGSTDNMAALSEEMKMIDIGASVGRSVERTRR